MGRTSRGSWTRMVDTNEQLVRVMARVAEELSSESPAERSGQGSSMTDKPSMKGTSLSIKMSQRALLSGIMVATDMVDEGAALVRILDARLANVNDRMGELANLIEGRPEHSPNWLMWCRLQSLLPDIA